MARKNPSRSNKKLTRKTKYPKLKSLQNNTSRSARKGASSRKPIGTAAIESVKRIVETLKPYELSQSERYRTYQAMMLDDAVYSAYDAGLRRICNAFSKYTVKYNTLSEDSKLAASFLRDNISGLRGQTMNTVTQAMCSFRRDGDALLEKMFRKGEGDLQGNWVFDSFQPVPMISLITSEPFTIVNDGRKVLTANQSFSAFTDSWNRVNAQLVGEYTSWGYKPIPMKSLVRVSSNINPAMESVLDACYTPWREKILLQNLTIEGSAKDLSGVPIIRIPQQLLSEAAADPTSQSGLMVAQLRADVANLHAGDQTHMIMPSDVQEGANTMLDFDVKFLGVEGGGKNFDTESLVEQRKRAIYNVWGAAHLLAGESGGGSYNQLDGQMSNHGYYVENDIIALESAWNDDIIPQLFKLNEWKLSAEDMPRIAAGSVDDLSLESLGKYTNRVASTGLLPLVPSVVNHILEIGQFPHRVDENATTEELREMMSNFTSKSGENNGGTSGTGSTQSSNPGSDSNGENAA